MRAVFASNNSSKYRDMVEFLSGSEIELVSVEAVRVASELGEPPKPEELFDTYFQNAQLKADSFAAWASMPALADDSGLEVFALGGRPGVHSAYFGGASADHGANNRKLLEELRGVDDRRALFRSFLCLRVSSGEYLTAEGTVEGVITREPRGRAGWGYEPLFEIPALGKTIAELRDEGVPLPSHRARAVENLRELFRLTKGRHES